MGSRRPERREDRIHSDHRHGAVQIGPQIVVGRNRSVSIRQMHAALSYLQSGPLRDGAASFFAVRTAGRLGELCGASSGKASHVATDLRRVM